MRYEKSVEAFPKRERFSSATVERWFLWNLKLLSGERISRECPQILGIRRVLLQPAPSSSRDYATTFCDLKSPGA
jgi:hypothetical protein